LSKTCIFITTVLHNVILDTRQVLGNIFFISSPEQKVLRVSYCDRPLSVVRRASIGLKSWYFRVNLNCKSHTKYYAFKVNTCNKYINIHATYFDPSLLLHCMYNHKKSKSFILITMNLFNKLTLLKYKLTRGCWVLCFVFLKQSLYFFTVLFSDLIKSATILNLSLATNTNTFATISFKALFCIDSNYI